MVTWRAGLTTSWHVARGTTARVRRGAEVTWQSRGWPKRGAGGAQGAAMWQGATHPRESMWVPVWGATWQVRSADGGPMGIVGPGSELGALTQMRYCAPIFNLTSLCFFFRVGLCSHMILMCRWRGDRTDVGSIRRLSIAWTESTRSAINARAQKKE